MSPDHKTDPLRGMQGQGSRHSRDDMDLRGESEIVEKDSPPTSFHSLGQTSIDIPQLPRNHSHQLPQSRGQSAGGVVSVGQDREAHGHMMRHNLGQVGSRHGPNTSTGYGILPSSNGSRMRPSTSAGSGIGHYPTQPSARGQDLNYPQRKYPLQETTSSSHVPPLKSNSQSRLETSLSGNRLEAGIDREIVSAADDMKMQVEDEGAGQESAPYDPNLECPTCKKKFRIGQIQLFRQHAATCNNKRAFVLN